MTVRGRAAFVSLLTAALLGGLAFYILGFARERPATVQTGSSVGVTEVTLQTVAQLGYGPKADWVSYLIKRPDGRWGAFNGLPGPRALHRAVHHPSVRRRHRPSQPVLGEGHRHRGRDDRRGRQGGVGARPRHGGGAHVHHAELRSVVSPWQRSRTTPRISARWRRAPRRRRTAPSPSSIKTGEPGTFRFQCIIPCAAGFAEGWGGPMQTIGYMDGLMEVV